MVMLACIVLAVTLLLLRVQAAPPPAEYHAAMQRARKQATQQQRHVSETGDEIDPGEREVIDKLTQRITAEEQRYAELAARQRARQGAEPAQHAHPRKVPLQAADSRAHANDERRQAALARVQAMRQRVGDVREELGDLARDEHDEERRAAHEREALEAKQALASGLAMRAPAPADERDNAEEVAARLRKQREKKERIKMPKPIKVATQYRTDLVGKFTAQRVPIEDNTYQRDNAPAQAVKDQALLRQRDERNELRRVLKEQRREQRAAWDAEQGKGKAKQQQQQQQGGRANDDDEFIAEAIRDDRRHELAGTNSESSDKVRGGGGGGGGEDDGSSTTAEDLRVDHALVDNQWQEKLQLSSGSGSDVVAAGGGGGGGGRFVDDDEDTGSSSRSATVASGASWHSSADPLLWRQQQVRCAEQMRIGLSVDGGWVVCLRELDADSVVYSFGFGADISFEAELVDALDMRDANLYAYDPTPTSQNWFQVRNRTRAQLLKDGRGDEAQQLLPEQINFGFVGLSPSDTSVRLYKYRGSPHWTGHLHEYGHLEENRTFPAKSLATLMRENGHEHISLLKIDTEGSEWGALRELLRPPRRFDQLLVEFHDFDYMLDDDEPQSQLVSDVVAALNDLGLRTFDVGALRTKGIEHGYVTMSFIAVESDDR